MATWMGIDVGSTSVKVALVRSAYRKLTLERLVSVDVTPPVDTAAAVREAVAKALDGLPPGLDAIATAIDGNKAAIHRLLVPATAQRQLSEVLAYELESQVPFDMEGAVFDWRVLERLTRDPTGAARRRSRGGAHRRRAGSHRSRAAAPSPRSPSGSVSAAFVLGALAPHIASLAEHEAVAIVDLGAKASEVLVLERGEPVFARTLSTGTEGLPATAPRLARDIRVSLAAHQRAAAPHRRSCTVRRRRVRLRCRGVSLR